MRLSRWIVVAAFASLVLAAWALDLGEYLELSTLKAQRSAWRSYHDHRPAESLALYTVVYAIAAAASIPGAALLTLAGGAAFGLTKGVAATSFASTLGATLAFLASRHVLQDAARRRFKSTLTAVDNEVRRDGAFYLLTLRLVPVFPFFAVNTLMGLTAMRTRTYVWVSLLGMLPGTIVFVNAGTELAQLESTSDLTSPGLIGAFTLLGVLPLAARPLVRLLKDRRALAKYQRPDKFDYDVVVVGAGAAGLVASYAANTLRARVALVERHAMGGDCLNTGCVPSKALLHHARLAADTLRDQPKAASRSTADLAFVSAMGRVNEAIEAVEPHDSPERYRGLGVDVLFGNATVTSPYTVLVAAAGDPQTLTTRSVIVATGAHPAVPDIPGLADMAPLTSDTVWGLKHRPGRLVVLGGGPIGCELAQGFQRLGSQVTVIESGARLLSRDEPEASALVHNALQQDGALVLTQHTVDRFSCVGQLKLAHCSSTSGERTIEFDTVLVAVGRRPSSRGFGLDKLGVEVEQDGRIRANAYLQTSVPNLYVCGDVTGPHQLTHAASHQAWYAAANALLRPFWRLRADGHAMPRCTFTDPEVASVGLTVAQAKLDQTSVEVTRYDLAELDRAITDRSRVGFVQVLTPPGRDTILGVCIVARHADDMLSEWTFAMQHKLGLKKILQTVHPYPTYGEANKLVAGKWAQAHSPRTALDWLARIHRFRRGG